jgi:hypothetical protein
VHSARSRKRIAKRVRNRREGNTPDNPTGSRSRKALGPDPGSSGTLTEEMDRLVAVDRLEDDATRRNALRHGQPAEFLYTPHRHQRAAASVALRMRRLDAPDQGSPKAAEAPIGDVPTPSLMPVASKDVLRRTCAATAGRIQQSTTPRPLSRTSAESGSGGSARNRRGVARRLRDRPAPSNDHSRVAGTQRANTATYGAARTGALTAGQRPWLTLTPPKLQQALIEHATRGDA